MTLRFISDHLRHDSDLFFLSLLISCSFLQLLRVTLRGEAGWRPRDEHPPPPSTTLLWDSGGWEACDSSPSKELSHPYPVSQPDTDISKDFLSARLKARVTVTLHKCVSGLGPGVAPAAVPLPATRGPCPATESHCFFLLLHPLQRTDLLSCPGINITHRLRLIWSCTCRKYNTARKTALHIKIPPQKC